MARKRFWNGFVAGLGAGAAAGFGSWLLSRTLRNRQHDRIVRLEKSIQIGRPLEEVFRTWSQFEQLPSLLRMIENVEVRGSRSHWVVRVDGRRAEWEAELTQRVANEALGWKSVNGPKHTGRINFASLGNDTQVHVVMNYSPPLGLFGRSLSEQTGILDACIEQALRDFKAALEGKGQETSGRSGESSGAGRRVPTGVLGNEEARATGTLGRTDAGTHAQTSRYGGPPNPVEYTRPPEAKT